MRHKGGQVGGGREDVLNMCVVRKEAALTCVIMFFLLIIFQF